MSAWQKPTLCVYIFEEQQQLTFSNQVMQL